MEQARKCMFCLESLSGNKSKEHVIPKWLLNHLNISDISIKPSFQFDQNPKSVPLDPSKGLYSFEELRKLPKRELNLKNLVEGRVCQTCNNGWMSELENNAKSILIPLINSSKLVEELTKEEKFVISRWLFKTSSVLNSSAGYRKIISDEQIRIFFQDSRSFPKGFYFFCQQHNGNEPFWWIQTQSWHNQKIDNIEEKRVYEEYPILMKKSFKISLQIGKLILLTAYWPPVDGWYMLLVKGVHYPLWAWQRPCLYSDEWPFKSPFPWEDSIKATISFDFSLGIGYENSDKLKQIKRSNYVHGEKIERNSPCYCGSGKKFKKCHGNL